MFWRGVWGYLPANVVQGVVGFLTLVLFTRLLSPDDFGRYAVAFAVFSLAHVAVFTWIEAAMARFWAAESQGSSLADHFAGLYQATLALSLIFLPVMGLAIWLWPMDMAFRIAVAVGVAGVPLRCVARLVQERYRAAGEVAKSAWMDIFTTVAGLAFGVGFALLGAGAASPLIGLGLAPLVLLPFVLPAELRFARGGRADPARLLSYARYGYPIAVSLALTLVLGSTDRILLAVFMDEAATGAYHAAYSLANRTLDVLFIWLGAAGGPALVMALERHGHAGLKEAAREQASTFLLIGIPAAVGLALVARPMAEFMIGEDLRGSAAAITPWIAFAALMSGLSSYYFGQAFTLGKRTSLLFITMAIPALANVVLNLILIPVYGVMGAAWATAASLGLGLTSVILIGRRVVALPIPVDSLIRIGVASAAMALVVRALPSPGGFVELMMDATVGATVYGALVITLNAAGVRDVIMDRARRLKARSAPA